MENPRSLALSILNKCVSVEQYSNLALDTAIRRHPLSDADRGLLTTLVYGVLEKQLTLDHWIGSLCEKQAPDLPTRNLLRLGLYQLAFLDRIPDHAAVNETVSLAPKRSRGFVNAVLRAFLRLQKQIPLPDGEKDPVSYLSVRYSFSPAICERFLRVFGRERTESLLEAFCHQPPVTLRVNTLRTDRDALIASLKAAGAQVSPTPESDNGILASRLPVTAMPGFEEGLFFVQDEASQLCVEALDAQEGMTLIDVCACPGSKSFGAAIDMNDTGRVLSCDLHANKLTLVTSGAERLGIGVIETFARDSGTFEPLWVGIADRVLCDVPCSGLGVFAKKPELRYKDPKQSERLPTVQRRILEASCRYVREGGLLVYSTCTLLPEENEENVSAFLRDHGEFFLLRQRTLYPDTDGTDGFYFAVLQKNTKDAPV